MYNFFSFYFQRGSIPNGLGLGELLVAFQTFGPYIKRLREAAGISSQLELAEKLSVWGAPASTSMIAKYEAGEVKDPDPKALYGIALICKGDYFELIMKLVEDKYRLWKNYPADPQRDLHDARWAVLERSLKRFESIGGISAADSIERLERLQLLAKAKLIGQEEMLDVHGLAEWEMSFPNLEKFWVAALDFADNDNADILGAVARNLSSGAIYVYFVPPTEIASHGSFWLLKGQLEQLLDNSIVTNQLIAIPMDHPKLQALNYDYAIANPHDLHGAVGFQCIRRGDRDQPAYAFRTQTRQLRDVVSHLATFIDQHPDEAIKEKAYGRPRPPSILLKEKD